MNSLYRVGQQKSTVNAEGKLPKEVLASRSYLTSFVATIDFDEKHTYHYINVSYVLMHKIS